MSSNCDTAARDVLKLLSFSHYGFSKHVYLLMTVIKAIFENMDVLGSVMEPITLGTMGTQKPYRFDFEQYVQEARTKMPTRKAAGIDNSD